MPTVTSSEPSLPFDSNPANSAEPLNISLQISRLIYFQPIQAQYNFDSPVFPGVHCSEIPTDFVSAYSLTRTHLFWDTSEVY